MKFSIPKILIFAPTWVGDMVMAQVLFKTIKQHTPQAQIDVIVPAWCLGVAARMPEIRQVLPLGVGRGELALIKRYQKARELRNQYDQAILLPNSLKSALIPFLAKIPKRTGWLGEYRWGLLNDIRHLDKKKLPLMIQRFAALGLAPDQTLAKILPWPSLQISEDNLKRALTIYHLSTEKKILALCPGAEYGSAKRWPAAYFAELAREKLHAGWQVWIFGSAKDQVIAAEIQQATAQACNDLTGKTTLEDAIDLLSLAEVVVSNDSGLMHVAAALERPLVVLYGSSDPRFTPPLSHNVKIMTLNLPCSPCFKRECPLEHLNCLKELKPQQVLNAIEEVCSWN